MSVLTKVLGDYKIEVTTGSLGDITDFGTYSVWSGNVQDSPISDYSFLLYVKKRGGSTYQIAVGSTTINVPRSFMRVKYSNNNSWSDWKEFSLISV